LSLIKTIYFVAVALASFVLGGCASETTTTTQTDQTTKRVYTQEELRKTGETQTGPALEKVDPAVRSSGNR
jgi:outer membrane biogenesis lipoprotein LolB